MERERERDKTRRVLTGFKAYFANHKPLSVEVQLHADCSSNSMRDRNDDVAREVDERVAHVLVDDRLTLEVAGSR